jgi:hypothetical protein
MAVIYASGLRTTRMTAVRDAIDAGVSYGKLIIYTAGYGSPLATITLTDPCGTVSGDTLTLDFDPDIAATAGNTGTAAIAKILTSADAEVVTGLTVGTSASNINLNTTSIVSGATVTITDGTITHNTAG